MIDMQFGRMLLGKDATANDVLRHMIPGYNLKQLGGTSSSNNAVGHVQPILTLAAFLAVFDEKPKAGYTWIRKNRLSFFSIPGFKGQVYENLSKTIEKQKVLGFNSRDLAVVRALAHKLRPLKGL